MTKPTPVVVTTICSLCDEPWEAHGDKPTAEDCVRLLKAKIASMPRPVTIINPPAILPYPVYPRPVPYWERGGTWCGSSGGTAINCDERVQYRTPAAIEVTCRAA